MKPPDNFDYIVHVESTFHTQDSPFCFTDGNCPCHKDQEKIEKVNAWVQEGLMTRAEAANFILGRTV